MTQEELTAVAETVKESADLVEKLRTELATAKSAKPTEDQVKAAVDGLIASRAIDPSLRDQATAALAQHDQTLDFLVSLAHDRAKLASARADWPELAPGGAVGTPTSGVSTADDEFDAGFSRLRASMGRI